MGFEVFQKSSAPSTSVPFVTIQKRGLITINRAAYDMLGAPEAVEFLWDSERRVVGFRAASPETPNAYPLRPQGVPSPRGSLVAAGSVFTRFIGWDTSQAHRFTPTIEDGVLCISLDQGRVANSKQ